MSKLIAYIDKDNVDGRERSSVIKTALAPGFNLRVLKMFDHITLNGIRENLSLNNENSYQALVTYFPYNPQDLDFLANKTEPLKGEAFYKKAYKRSIDLVNSLKSSRPNFPVILYTGMITEDVPKDHEKRQIVEGFLDGLNVDAYLYKGRDYNWDAKRIKKKLCEILGE